MQVEVAGGGLQGNEIVICSSSDSPHYQVVLKYHAPLELLSLSSCLIRV